MLRSFSIQVLVQPHAKKRTRALFWRDERPRSVRKLSAVLERSNASERTASVRIRSVKSASASTKQSNGPRQLQRRQRQTGSVASESGRSVTGWRKRHVQRRRLRQRGGKSAIPQTMASRRRASGRMVNQADNRVTVLPRIGTCLILRRRALGTTARASSASMRAVLDRARETLKPAE